MLAAVVALVLMAAAVAVVLLVPQRAGDQGSPDPGAPSVPAAATGPIGDVVPTTSGRVRGFSDGGVRSWLGLPFAAPPTGRLRWRAPQAPASWDGVRRAREAGAACLQPDQYTFGDESLTARPGSSEDCLFLNVVRPADDTRGLPVMVWLHGGGFFGGNGATAALDGHALVERGVVLVTVNYRLGRLGFFGHPSLGGDVANFGLLDQVAALRWVRANVAAFGGDAANVTLFGGSAGAMSVNALMSSPVADGLFDRAISQSAPSDDRARTLADVRERGAAAFPGLSAGELRALPGDDLLDSTFNTLSGDAPVVDSVLPESAARAFARGDEIAVPYLVGTTADEFSDDDFRAFGVDPDELRGLLGGTRHDRLVTAYGDAYAADVLDDVVFDLPAVERAVAHGRRAPTFRYVLSGVGYSGHGAEGDYVFDTVSGGRAGRLADAVADYWVAFARTGRPEVDGLAAWPEASGAEGSSYLSLQPGDLVVHPQDPLLSRFGALRAALS